MAVDTADGRNPAPSRMYKTLWLMGKPTNLNWLAGFVPSTLVIDNLPIFRKSIIFPSERIGH